jgi:hypothetical protein
VIRRAVVAFPGGIHAEPLLEEPLVHAAIQTGDPYPTIDRAFTAADHPPGRLATVGDRARQAGTGSP